MIKYTVVKSNLKTHADGFVGRVRSTGTIRFEQLVDLVARSNTTVAKSDVLSVLEDYHSKIEELVQGGETVVTPHVIVCAGIRGTFQNLTDMFDPLRHRIVVRVSVAKRLRRAMRDVQVEKLRTNRPAPRPGVYLDTNSDRQNSVLTPGGGGQVLGEQLRSNPADPAQGVFFVDAAGTATRVEQLIVNTLAQLAFVVPNLAPGPYMLEVRATIRNNPEVRTGKLDEVLIVG
jgi:hypothetical protein